MRIGSLIKNISNMENISNKINFDTEQSVVEKVVSGDIASFEVLIRRYNPVLYKIARSYGFNHQDAEDLMQDTHVSAYQALSKFENRSSYKTWISRIMVNKCLYKLKYGHFKNEIPKDEMKESEISQHTNKSIDTKTEDLLLNRELTIILEKSLHNIPVIYRTVFVLREVEGFSTLETADLLQISPINVKVRLNRAKALLQKQIEKHYSHQDIYSFNLIYCDSVVHRVFEKISRNG